MKSFLATTAIVLLMGGSAYAASAKLDAYQAQASDIDASKFIGQTVYASKNDVSADQQVANNAKKDWDNIGDINEVVFDRNGSVKAVVIGVGGFLGMGEKNVAVSLNDIKFIRNGNGANDYFLVVNSTKEALNAAPAFKTPDEIREANNTPPAADATTTADNTTLAKPADTTASNNTTTNDMSKKSMSNNTAANTTVTPADNTDKTTTASTTNNNTSVQTTMNDNRARLTPPTVTREGYATAKVEDLTADKLEGATVYGPKDENIGKISHLVMNDNGKGVKLFVLDVGGFLGIGAHTIAVTPQELNIVRNAKGDDVRVYIDSNKQALKAQPEYKVQ